MPKTVGFYRDDGSFLSRKRALDSEAVAFLPDYSVVQRWRLLLSGIERGL